MNAYDWDKTIYSGDSTCDLVRYLWRKRPITLFNIPRIIWYGVAYKLGKVSREAFKTNLYTMFRYVDDMDEVVDEFVERHLDKVKQWYLEQQKLDDIVISASPQWLIERFCQEIGIKYCIASKVHMQTGTLMGETCRGEQKVHRLMEWRLKKFEQGDDDLQVKWPLIDKFYSDSLSDAPMARIARGAFLVKGDQITAWPVESLKGGRRGG